MVCRFSIDFYVFIHNDLFNDKVVYFKPKVLTKNLLKSYSTNRPIREVAWCKKRKHFNLTNYFDIMGINYLVIDLNIILLSYLITSNFNRPL